MITEQRQAPATSERQPETVNEGAPECRACRAAEQAVHTLLAQAANQSAPQDGDFNWFGVCNTHAWQFGRQAEPVRATIVARLQVAMQGLGESAPAGTGRFGQRRVPAVRPNREDCPFCMAMTAAAERVLETDAAPPACLCLPHLCTALGNTRRREHVQALTEMALTQFITLEEELSELIRKSDYRFRGEPRGREATSWTRAAQLLAGAPAVYWSLRRAPDIEG